MANWSTAALSSPSLPVILLLMNTTFDHMRSGRVCCGTASAPVPETTRNETRLNVWSPSSSFSCHHWKQGSGPMRCHLPRRVPGGYLEKMMAICYVKMDFHAHTVCNPSGVGFPTGLEPRPGKRQMQAEVAATLQMNDPRRKPQGRYYVIGLPGHLVLWRSHYWTNGTLVFHLCNGHRKILAGGNYCILAAAQQC